MSGIQTTIELSDRLSAPLYNICTAINATIAGFESMQYASGTAFDTTAFDGARENLAMGMAQLDEIVSNTQRASGKQEEYNQKIQEATGHAGNLAGKITALVGAYVGISTVKNVLGMSDELTQTTARLDMMVSQYNQLNGTMQTTTELSNMIYQSAQNSRASYFDTAASVAKLGNNAKDAFASTGEIVGFAELVNKQFVIAGASATESSNAFLQLTQALGSGVLRGDELRSIFEQAPNLIQNIADYMDVPIGQIRDMAAEGQITADIVKNAMFEAEDEINAKFEQMPMTWGQALTMFQNQTIMVFQPVLQKLNEMVNSTQIQTVVSGVIDALSVVATVALNVIDILAAGGAFIVDNWYWIAPIIGGVTVALGGYTIALGIHNTAQAISNRLEKASTTIKDIHAAHTAMQTGNTFAATVAQYGFNTALLACPLTWIVGGIILVIAAIYVIVAAINKAKGTTISATGVVAGIFASLGAHVINTFVVPAWNGFATLANFFGNVFNDPVGAVQVMFYDLCLTTLGYISNLASAIETLLNKIPGVSIDITSGLDGFYAKLEEAQQAVKDKSGWVEYVKKMDYIAYDEAYNKGYELGQGVEDKVKGFFATDENNPFGEYGDNLGSYGGGGMAENLNNIAGDTSDISNSLDVSQEDLKYLRDIAEQEAVNRFTTAEIKVDMSGMQNMVNNTNDIDGIVDELTTRVMSAMEVVRSGV